MGGSPPSRAASTTLAQPAPRAARRPQLMPTGTTPPPPPLANLTGGKGLTLGSSATDPQLGRTGGGAKQGGGGLARTQSGLLPSQGSRQRTWRAAGGAMGSSFSRGMPRCSSSGSLAAYGAPPAGANRDGSGGSKRLGARARAACSAARAPGSGGRGPTGDGSEAAEVCAGLCSGGNFRSGGASA